MKKVIFALLFNIPVLTTAQIVQVTEYQKQQACQCVANFCSLLEQFSNGKRTLIPQINALCSGADCSAYDDIQTNSETTLRNYLYAIQKKFPQELKMQISVPSLSKCSIQYQPLLSLSKQWTSVNGSDFSTTSMASAQIDAYTNAFIIFDVIQTIPSLGKTEKRKIIYDVNANRVTAFITGNGTYISFLKGLDFFSKKDYNTARIHFIAATENERTPYRRISQILSIVCSAYSLDNETAWHDAQRYNDMVLASYFGACAMVMKGDYEEAFSHARKCESLVEESKDQFYLSIRPELYRMLAVFYLMLPENTFSYHDARLGVSYLRKSMQLGSSESAYMLWTEYMAENINDEDMEDINIYDCLVWAGENNYPPAFFALGLINDVDDNKEEAVKWYEKSAKSGNPMGMACYGRLLVLQGNSFKNEGIQWLKKSLEEDILERKLADFSESMGWLPSWPSSREDVQKFLSQHTTGHDIVQENTIGSNVPQQTNSGHYSSTTQMPSVSTMSPVHYSHHRTRSHKFNHRQDSFFGAFSVGYIQKQWNYDDGEENVNVGVFDGDNFVNGIQVGLRIDPQLKYGFGINTGLFYEYYFAKSDEMYDESINYHYTFEEHCLYIPAHLKFSMNFSKWFQLSFYGGIGVDISLKGMAYLRSDGETFDSSSVYSDEGDWKKFNASFEYGASVRVRRLQLDVTFAKGLMDWSHDSSMYETKQNKRFCIATSVCF